MEQTHEAVVVRAGRPGDVGWALMRQAEVYTQEFGYAPLFEAYVADTVPAFLHGFDAALDGLWVAERDGERVGCIAIQHDAERPGWAKLRWYLVEPWARGQGIGSRLLDTALSFCRGRHDGVYLWTMSDLGAAARRYERAGFRLVKDADAPWKPSERQQMWELAL